MKAVRPFIIAAVAAGVITLIYVIVAARSLYIGTTAPYVAFNMAFAALVALVLPRPRSYAYGCFAVLLALGFWLKFLMHLIVDYPFVEPVGRFDGSPAAWDRVLSWAAIAAIATALPRCIQLIFVRFKREPIAPWHDEPPKWFVDNRTAVWTISLAALAIVAAVNSHESIYQIGVNPQIRLPRPLLVAVAWTIGIGGGLWLATLSYWENRLSRRSGALAWAATILEATMSSVSAMSRSIYLLRTLPYAFGQVAVGRLSRRGAAFAGAIFLLGFTLSISCVTVQRLHVFYEAKILVDQVRQPATTSTATVTTTTVVAPEAVSPSEIVDDVEDHGEYVAGYIIQTAMLASDRWIGLEGLLAVTSDADCGPSLLLAALNEDPARGYESYYQTTAGTRYKRLASLEQFTFLTLPGIVALCAYGGSAAYVFGGLFLATTFLMGCELACRRATGNPYLTSLVSLNFAYILHQMNFPYLTFVFVCELAVSIAVIALLTRVPLRKSVHVQFAKSGA